MPIPAGDPAPTAHVQVALVAPTIAADAREHVHVPVRLVDGAGVDADPTGLPARIALPAAGEEPAVWLNAGWETSGGGLSWQDSAGRWQTWPSTVRRAWIAVGTGGAVALTAGTYDVWVEIVTAAELVRRPAGTVTVI